LPFINNWLNDFNWSDPIDSEIHQNIFGKIDKIPTTAEMIPAINAKTLKNNILPLIIRAITKEIYGKLSFIAPSFFK